MLEHFTKYLFYIASDIFLLLFILAITWAIGEKLFKKDK